MSRIHDEMRRNLAEKDTEYRRLMSEHASCESRLQELQGKADLTETERTESIIIKKQKLNLKDRMEAILRQYMERETGAGVP